MLLDVLVKYELVQSLRGSYAMKCSAPVIHGSVKAASVASFTTTLDSRGMHMYKHAKHWLCLMKLNVSLRIMCFTLCLLILVCRGWSWRVQSFLSIHSATTAAAATTTTINGSSARQPKSSTALAASSSNITASSAAAVAAAQTRARAQQDDCRQ
jgi:cytoskeletal protein RodZ